MRCPKEARRCPTASQSAAKLTNKSDQTRASACPTLWQQPDYSGSNPPATAGDKKAETNASAFLVYVLSKRSPLVPANPDWPLMTTMSVIVAVPIAIPAPLVLWAVVRGPVLILDRHTRHYNARRADGRCDIHRRRAIWRWLSNDHTRKGKRNTDSDTHVDPGLGEGHATYENRCN